MSRRTQGFTVNDDGVLEVLVLGGSGGGDGGLTDAQLRASPVAVDDADTQAALAALALDVQANLTDGELRASPVGVTDADANTKLDAIKTAVELLDNVVAGFEMQVDLVGALPAGNNNIGDVDVSSVPADPFGANADAAATAGAVASMQARLRLMTSQLDAIQTALQTLDNAIAGTELQVDVVGSLPAGNNNIGDVDLASAIPAGTNNIGDVDIASAIPAGNNNIGDVDIASALPAGDNNIGNIDVASQPALAATVDAVTAKLATDAIQNGLTALTPKFVIIDAATSGDNTILAAVASKKIRVLSVFLIASAAVTARFESGAGGTALTGQMNVGANGGFVLPFNPVGWFETASNTLLNLELSAATSCDGCLVYVEV